MFLNTFVFLPEGSRTQRKPSTLATSSSGTSQPRIGEHAVSFFLAIHGLSNVNPSVGCVCVLLRAKLFSFGSSCLVVEGNSHCLRLPPTPPLPTCQANKACGDLFLFSCINLFILAGQGQCAASVMMLKNGE